MVHNCCHNRIRLYSICLIIFILNPASVLAVEVNLDRLSPISAVGINNKEIAFATGNSKSGKFEHVFNLASMTMEDNRLKYLRFREIKPAWEEYALTFPIDHTGNSKLNLRRLGRTIHEIDWRPLSGSRHRTFGFLRDGYWITGGENGMLAIYNTRAEMMASLIGHTGAISGLAFYDHWIVSGDTNGLIILWDLNDVQRGEKKIHPYLFLAYAKDGEWAAWSKEGFFSSSPKGHLLLDFTDETLNSEALVEIYRKPELLALKINSPKRFHQKVAQKLTSTGISPPTVALINIPRESQQRDIEILARVCDEGGGIESAVLYLRGAPIAIEEATRSIGLREKPSPDYRCNEYSRAVSLSEGDNEIVLVARNQYGIQAAPANSVVSYAGGAKLKPSLHIAAIAVTDYADDTLDLKYPVEDAKAVLNAFEIAGYGLFDGIYLYSFYDQDVTKKNLSSAFHELRARIGERDVFILFIAGHGVFSSEVSEYFFLPHDVKNTTYREILKGSLGTEEIKDLLAGIDAAQSLLLLDTCQSGGFDGFTKDEEEISGEQLKFVHRLGRASLMSSAKNQVAYEGYKGHGAFTSIVLDGMNGGADYTNDGYVSVDELSTYVGKHLPELTERKWGFRQEARRNMTGHDFILGKLESPASMYRQ
jgi:hypothetical protein